VSGIAPPVQAISGLRLDEVIDGLGDLVVVIDRVGTVLWANKAAVHMIGDDLGSWLGRSALDMLHPDDLALAAASLGTIQGKRAGSAIEVRIRSQFGWRLMELLGAPLEGGEVALVLRDLTERRRWEIAGDDVNQFRAIVHHAAGLTLLLDADGRVECATAAVTRLLGHDPEVIAGLPLQELIAPEDHEAFRLAVAQAVQESDAGGVAATVELGLARHDGTYMPVEASIVSLLNDPVVNGLVVSCHDITRLRAAQQKLSLLAHHDSVTGLYNRRFFDAALEREWTLTQRDGIDTFVVVIDLDGFKGVNDRHGHASGDKVLAAVAARMEGILRDTDVCGRLGGDEFGVLLVRCGGEAAAMGFCARLEEALALELGIIDEGVGASCGYQSLRRASSPAEALNGADLAMLEAKARRARGR
jgi:diguanylate cyclase (GGDEF)-like protein/PAS domain S-box-containing protein